MVLQRRDVCQRPKVACARAQAMPVLSLASKKLRPPKLRRHCRRGAVHAQRLSASAQ